MNEKLYKRAIFDEIKKYLLTDDIIVLHGARQVGKTHILYYIENYLAAKKENMAFIDLEDSRFVVILDGGVENFFGYLKEEGFLSKRKKKLFVFIDEIQYLKNPSSFLKLIYDHHKNIKLIVSRSSSFAVKSKFKDSLVGRTINFEIFNLSFEEFLLFKNYVFKKENVHTPKKIDELRKLFSEYVIFGGYPKIVLTAETEKREKYLQQIIDTYIKRDIRDLADIKDIDKFNKLLEILASQSGNLLNVAELSNTCRISKPTVEKYLFIMENTYVIRLVRPFSRNTHSELFKVPKIYFYDSGLAQMLWFKRLPKKIIGSIFETGVFSELAKKYGKDQIFYWRTKDKKEIDFIIKENNVPIPVEAKLNFAQFKPGSIKYFCEKYGVKSYKVAGLEGEPKNRFFVYPWNL